MSENPLSISYLNDFIFCPVSIYFHNLEEGDSILIQNQEQINGTNAHKNSDLATYSSRKNVLQGTAIYCERYNLCGKLDTFDIKTGILTERKNKITTIYDGYIFQIYAQYFALKDMQYNVSELRLYSMSNNKVYVVEKPETNIEMMEKFEKLLKDINSFNFDSFIQDNIKKCKKCIYEPLCSFSKLKGDVCSAYRT